MGSLDALAEEKGYVLEPCTNRKKAYYLLNGRNAVANPKTGLPFFSASEACAFLISSQPPKGKT